MWFYCFLVPIINDFETINESKQIKYSKNSSAIAITAETKSRNYEKWLEVEIDDYKPKLNF